MVPVWRNRTFSATLPGLVWDLVATSAIGGNVWSQRGRSVCVTEVLRTPTRAYTVFIDLVM